jgi:hypothetical protein
VEDRGGEDRPPAAWRTRKVATDGAGSLEDRGEDVGSPEDRGESASSLQDSGEDAGSMEDRERAPQPAEVACRARMEDRHPELRFRFQMCLLI